MRIWGISPHSGRWWAPGRVVSLHDKSTGCQAIDRRRSMRMFSSCLIPEHVMLDEESLNFLLRNTHAKQGLSTLHFLSFFFRYICVKWYLYVTWHDVLYVLSVLKISYSMLCTLWLAGICKTCALCDIHLCDTLLYVALYLHNSPITSFHLSITSELIENHLARPICYGYLWTLTSLGVFVSNIAVIIIGNCNVADYIVRKWHSMLIFIDCVYILVASSWSCHVAQLLSPLENKTRI